MCILTTLMYGRDIPGEAKHNIFSQIKLQTMDIILTECYCEEEIL